MASAEHGLNMEEADGPDAMAAAPTGVAAFVGHTSAGPVDEAVRVSSFAAFQGVFGGLDRLGPLSYAVNHFFLNGGASAWVVRVKREGAQAEEDGRSIPNAAEVIGTRAKKSGIYALENAIFDVLNLPEVLDPAALSEALAYAEERRSMILIDMGSEVDTPEAARAWIEDPAREALRRPNAAVHFPRLVMDDPLDGNGARAFACSGAIAGLWARTDAAEGVWKAPAGIGAALHGPHDLARRLDDGAINLLNPLGVNCLRVLPEAGVVNWGGRTLSRDPAWKFLPVRRLALMIEESLASGLRFATFAPNGEPLWARIRRVVGSFMHDLFSRGAFQGASDGNAYFVRCGPDTTSRTDIANGIVNVVVGFAPLRPAEFIIIHVAQRAAIPEPSPLATVASSVSDSQAAFDQSSTEGAASLALDVRRVVSKYVGDTEAALAVIFVTAENRGASPVFDEADPLFGRRSEVGDAHDRFAGETY